MDLWVDGGKIQVSLDWPLLDIVTWNSTLWPLAFPLILNIQHSDWALPKFVNLAWFWMISTTRLEQWTSSNSSQQQLRGGISGEPILEEYFLASITQILEEYFLVSIMPLQQSIHLTKICAYNCIWSDGIHPRQRDFQNIWKECTRCFTKP